ncbi:MAG: transaldolase [Alphaproteobacteria bacterium]
MDGLTVKIYADGAELDSILKLAANPLIKGFTTNPTLMRKAGITDYSGFARELIAAVPDRPISFEVFADDLPEMASQAREIARWGANVNVKIPITNSKGESCVPIIEELSGEGVQLNITAIFTLDQVRDVANALYADTPAIVSVFAGRVADTGVDPLPIMASAVGILKARPKAELLWASPRELLNIFHADSIGCHIITVTHDVLNKLPIIGKDLDSYSLETVRMFYDDARSAGYMIDTGASEAAGIQAAD